MSNKKQTAVEWLKNELWMQFNVSFSDNIFEQAKWMENDQIIDSYSNGWHDGQDVIINKIKHIDFGGDDAGNKYYNETYGK